MQKKHSNSLQPSKIIKILKRHAKHYTTPGTETKVTVTENPTTPSRTQG
jgi:hypothetical protein